MQAWFTQLVSNRLTLLWGHEGEQLQVEHMETSVLLAGDALLLRYRCLTSEAQQTFLWVINSPAFAVPMMRRMLLLSFHP